MGQPETTMLQIFILPITFISFISKDCFKYFLLNSWKNQVIKRFKMFNKPVTELGTEPLLNCCPCLSDHITLNVLSTLQSTSHLSSLLRLTIILQGKTGIMTFILKMNKLKYGVSTKFIHSLC